MNTSRDTRTILTQMSQQFALGFAAGAGFICGIRIASKMTHGMTHSHQSSTEWPDKYGRGPYCPHFNTEPESCVLHGKPDEPLEYVVAPIQKQAASMEGLI